MRVGRISLRLLYLSLFFSYQYYSLAFALDIPISISEAKPFDVAGYTRINDLASFGIPLSESDNITSINQLGIVGSQDYQFRVLDNHKSGKIKWLLVDALVSVEAGATKTISLVDGLGNSSGSNLATDNIKSNIVDNNYITINTGVGVFVVRKKGFNFLDEVVVDGHTYIATNTAKGMIVNDGSMEYTSTLDSSSNTVIEENGPVKAVIKSQGTMKNAENAYLHYTARLYFTKQQKYCRAVITVRNASNDTIKNKKYISEFGVQIKMNTSGNIIYKLSRQNTDVSGTAPGSLYQGYNTTFKSSECDTTQENYSYIAGESGLYINGASYPTEYTQGYFQATNGAYSINAAMTGMFNYWPAGFEIAEDGNMAIDIYSPRNSVAAPLAWGQWQTREIIFEFTANSTSPQLTNARIQYPLMGRASLSQYNKAMAINGASDLISTSDEDSWISTNNGTRMSIAKNFSDLKFARKRNWNCPGGFQNDSNETDIINWVRTGNGVLFIIGRQEARLRVDDAFNHSDDFSYKTTPPTISDNTATYRVGYDSAHMYWETLPIVYYLTGDELLKDAMLDMLQWLDYETSATQYRSQNVVAGDMRVYSRNIKGLLLLSEVIGTQDYKNLSLNLAKMYIKSPLWNLDRGYILLSHSNEYKNSLGNFFTSRIHADMVFQMYRVTKDFVGNDDIAQDLSDRTLGWAYFFINEFTNNEGSSAYDYDTTNTNTLSVNYPCESAWYHTHAYRKTGDTNFLERRKGINYVVGIRGNKTYGERGIQGFINADLHRDANTFSYINPIGTGRVDLANGVSHVGANYTITFQAPINATNYQIKVSSQPMVDNLGFNQASRTYTFDPAIYANFWAAMNIRQKITPTSGNTQTVAIDLVKAFADYNSLYGLTSIDSAYKIYDPNMNYYFAIKYESNDSKENIAPVSPSGLRLR